MGKWIRRILIVILLGIFLFSGIKLLMIRHRYKVSERIYNEAASMFTKPSASSSGSTSPKKDEATPGPAENTPASEDEASPALNGREPEYAPLEVDFEYLLQINGEVAGWIYCPDTVINYPVVLGSDNDFYLTHDYIGNLDSSGAIFIDASNKRDLSDSNIILYGHNMQDRSMFASLKNWQQQGFFDEHPCMWLLTPEQDYRIELFSAYDTRADSDSYMIFKDSGEGIANYLQMISGSSVTASDTELDPNSQYIMLSTCAYGYELARSVLHGRLVPLDSAGGIPIGAPAAEKPIQ